ncbi:toll/interleukin-1 receptor domain-containing protein [Corallococcus sp. AS-1-12]|uniref:toll/interleukin-1 receptor domain-containing protein n=1 Tax=Corallococcus sp. AS-1-12 TaxID=2874598 RepID=UPI001CBE5844|nr:toll/interleukin-1 receptor domain-containing protein [Corallococcus sp. AS-1-12]
MKKVFISYAQEGKIHNKRVRKIADRFRKDDVNCMIDQYVEGTPEEGWPQWMENQLVEADYVLIVCTATYLRRYELKEAPGKGLGAVWESMLTRQLLYAMQGRNKTIIPVLLEGASVDDIPLALKGVTWYKLPESYRKLCQYINGRMTNGAPPLGSQRSSSSPDP